MSRERWLRLDGRRVRYLEAGAGSPLVIAHGLGLSSTIWARHFPAFTSIGLRVVAPDLPRFGGSEGPAFGQTVEELAEWLLAFADRIGVAKAAWLGHSLAAQTVIELAVRSPARARALILATPTGAPGRFRLLRQAANFARDIGREPPALIPAVLREYVKGSPTAFLGTWVKAARDDPARKARSVHCPTLIVVGREDPVVSDSYLHILAHRMPRSRIARMRGGSHGVVFERWREFDRLAADFLRRAPH